MSRLLSLGSSLAVSTAMILFALGMVLASNVASADEPLGNPTNCASVYDCGVSNDGFSCTSTTCPELPGLCYCYGPTEVLNPPDPPTSQCFCTNDD
jgi:hypothetical protein